MARNNYGFEKRQREMSKERKKEEKRQRKLDRKTGDQVGENTTESEGKLESGRGADRLEPPGTHQ